MTSSLKKAFEKTENLPVSDQKLLAMQILQDIKNEILWKTSLESASGKVSTLANIALKEHKAGKTIKGGFGK
jgi:hypothetical protein